MFDEEQVEFADIMSVHNRNMKHACTIEFD